MAVEIAVVPVEFVERRIYLIRGHKVMLDRDLAELYQVKTFNLNKAVKRNLDRFPTDFMFQLSKVEAASLRFQIGMSKPSGRGAGAICRMPSLNTAWRCCLPSCAASGLSQ
jgi:hypothetical protein